MIKSAIGNGQLAIMKITSRDNPLLRRARAVRDGKIIETIFVEGLRLCEEALDSRLSIEAIIYSEEIVRKERAAQIIKRVARATSKIAVVSEKLLQSISYTKTPQGIVILAARPHLNQNAFNKRQAHDPLLLVLHGINNPVNVGAILRTAEAAGVTGVITTIATSDPFSPKALRGAMGSVFRLPVLNLGGYREAIDYCNQRRIQTISADVSATKMFSEVNWRVSTALIMGPESSGLSSDEVALSAQAVQIPMRKPVESLNVAVAAGVILYEAARQRGRW